MVVVAIIGILAAVALPSYPNYIETANMSRVQTQFREAKRATEASYAQSMVQMQLDLTLSVPSTDSDWIALYNPRSNTAPGGGNAFVAGAANATTGQIGVTSSGVFLYSLLCLLEILTFSGVFLLCVFCLGCSVVVFLLFVLILYTPSHHQLLDYIH